MGNPAHIDLLRQGTEIWNRWRTDNPRIRPDLVGADLSQTELDHADLSWADLSTASLQEARLVHANLDKANLAGANLYGARLFFATLREAQLKNARLNPAFLADADLSGADLSEAALGGADLEGATLNGAVFDRAVLSYANLNGAHLEQAYLAEAMLNQTQLTGARLMKADLSDANLTGAVLNNADLSHATLDRAILVNAKLNGAILTGCSIFGISAWGIELEGAAQTDLRITPPHETAVTVDNLEVAQFTYLLLNNRKIRDVISTIGQKAVLILGRFSPERKAVLDAVAAALRERNFLPIIFDFERSQERDITETIKILAGLSLFIVSDITNPKSNPLELQATVPDYMVPFVPIIQKGEEPFAMFADLWRHHDWVVRLVKYTSKETLLAGLDEHVIKPALNKHNELIARRAKALEIVEI